MSPLLLLTVTIGAFAAMLIGLAIWSARQAPDEEPETTPATERCPRCRGRLAVVEITPGRGQVLRCAKRHRWQVRRLESGAQVLAIAPACRVSRVW